MRHARTPKFHLSGPTVHSLYCALTCQNFRYSLTLTCLYVGLLAYHEKFAMANFAIATYLSLIVFSINEMYMH